MIEAFAIFNFILWLISGILTFIGQKMGVKIEYSMYWICYGCFMCNLLMNLIAA